MTFPFEYVLKWNLFLILLRCRYAAQETIIIINVENSYSALYCGNCFKKDKCLYCHFNPFNETTYLKY